MGKQKSSDKKSAMRSIFADFASRAKVRKQLRDRKAQKDMNELADTMSVLHK